MKKTIENIFIAVLFLFVSSSCSFLEVDERGKTDTDSFFAEIEGLRTALTGLYSCAYDFFDDQILKYGEVAGDNLQSVSIGSDASMYYQYNFLSEPDQESSAVGYIWRRGYVVITNANTILNYTDELKEEYRNNVEEITKIEGQALFMRALAHMSLVLCYAQPYGYTKDASHIGIPLVTYVVGTSERLSRKPVRMVYDQIVKDLEKAKACLGEDTGDTDYVNGPACDALLSRVYLYMEKYDKAEEYADKVISKFKLTPHDQYLAMFTGEGKGSEAIFRLTGKYAGQRMRIFYDYESPHYLPADELTSSFSPDDIRAGLLKAPDGHKACMKYYDLKSDSPVERYYRLNILRLSEIYLIRAEARCMQDDLKGAVDDMKQVMARAKGVKPSEISDGQISASDRGELMECIKVERNKELCFEGHRFFDLARWGDDVVRFPGSNSSVKRLEYPDYRFVLPIPQVEMEANEAMEQNEGY